jgi:hypothetical protein
MASPLAADSTLAADREEYYAVMDETTKLSHRRQTTNDLLTGINIVFLTAMGAVFVASHLTSWWATAILGLITAFAWLFDITWIRLLNRYSAVISLRISLRISYLGAIERRLCDAGVFVKITIPLESSTQTVTTRGVYTLERDVLYRRGNRNRGGFIRRERFLVILFMGAELVVTGSVAALTELIALHVLARVAL